MRYLLILPFFLLLICGVLCADTIVLKEGQKLKGVVIEEYHDRVVFSTEKGETCLLKKDIEKIGYDIPEENLVRLGALYKDKGDYNIALYYYEKAYKLNPQMKEAQDGFLLVTNMIFRKRESDLEKEVALRQDTEQTLGKPITEGVVLETGPSEADIKELWDKIGISIENIGPDIKVAKILKKSPAYEAGIEAQDIIVSIWGKLIRYMQLKEVYGLFLHTKVSEFKIIVSRGTSLTLQKKRIFRGAEERIGGKLSMEFEGLTINEVRPGGPLEKAGVLKGDRIVQLGGTATRYMPLESICKLIEDTKTDVLNLEIQREITFWKRG